MVSRSPAVFKAGEPGPRKAVSIRMTSALQLPCHLATTLFDHLDCSYFFSSHPRTGVGPGRGAFQIPKHRVKSKSLRADPKDC